MKKHRNSDIKKFVLNWILFFIILAGTLYITSVVLIVFFPENIKLIELSVEFKIISSNVFSYLKPFIVLIVILYIMELLFAKLGIDLADEINSLIKRVKAK